MTYFLVVLLSSIVFLHAKASVTPTSVTLSEVSNTTLGFPWTLTSHSGLVQTVGNDVYILAKNLSASDGYCLKKAPIASTGTLETIATLPFLPGLVPLTFVIYNSDLKYIVAEDQNKTMWLLGTKIEAQIIQVNFYKEVITPEKFTEETYFTQRSYLVTGQPCFDIYFCGTTLRENGKYKGFLGRISTYHNLTGPIVTTGELYNAKCSGVAIDPTYNQVVAGYGTESEQLGNIHFEARQGWQPVNRSPNWNIAIVTYPFDLRKENWGTMLGDRTENDILTAITVFEQSITVVVNSKNRTFSPETSYDGFLYTLSAHNGDLLGSPVTFGATGYHATLAAYSSYQGKLVLVEAEGQIKDSTNTYTFTTISRGYAVLYFNLFDQLTDVLYYNKYYGSLAQFPPLVMCASVSSTELPNMVLIGGGSTRVTAYYGTGSFVKDGSSTCVKQTNNGNLCVSCTANNYLYEHTCSSDCTTPGTIKGSGYCAHCNRLCSVCTISNLAQCTQCKDTNRAAPECECENLDSDGTCADDCDQGYRAILGQTCVKRCPGGTLMINDWFGPNSEMARTTTTSVPSPSHVMEFAATTKGLKVPAPDWLTIESFPKAWTMTLWVNPKEWKNGTMQYLVKAFGYINLWRHEKGIDGIKYSYPRVRVGGNEPPAPVTDLVKAIDSLNVTKWTFLGITKRSIRTKDGTDLIELHIVSSTKNSSETPPTVADDGEALIGSLTEGNNRLDVPPTQLKYYIVLGGDVNETTDELLEGTSFDGYIREFKIISRYMSWSNLRDQKYHSHSQYWPDLLSYWRLDEVPSGDAVTLADSSPWNLSKPITFGSSIYPKMATSTSELELVLHRWDDLFTCWNPLGADKEIPSVAGTPLIYDAITNITSNYYVFDVEGTGKFATGDSVFVSSSDCYSGGLQIVAQKSGDYEDNKITWTAKSWEKSFNSIVPGNHYALCYYSTQYLTTQLMSWIYVAQAPKAIVPAKKLLYSQFENQLTLRSYGGDDGYDNKLHIAKSLKGVKYPDPAYTKVIKRLEHAYETIDFTGMDAGIYNAYWRPTYSESYDYFTQVFDVVIKKVDYAQIYFRTPILGYRSGLYTLEFNAEDVKEGDRVAFFQTVGANEICADPISPIYTFEHGRFPQIYFSSSNFSVKSFVSGSPFVQVKLCFNAKVMNSSGTSLVNTKPYIDFYSISSYDIPQSANVELEGEIVDLHPPLLNPSMFAEENITFRIQSKENDVYSFKEGGLIAINEIFPVYQYNRFTATAASQIVPIAQNTFQVPFSRFRSGREYELIIGGNSFEADTHKLFGSQSIGARPFRYRFRTYDFSVFPVGPLLSKTNTLIVNGKNLIAFHPGVLIDGYEVIYNTSSLKAELSLKNSDCGIQPTFNSTNFTDTQLILEGVDFHGCSNGDVLLTLNITRTCLCIKPAGCSCASISPRKRANDPSFFTKGGNLINYPIGNIGCHKSCLACDGITDQSCILCKKNSELPILLAGRCIAKCPDHLPLEYNKTVYHNGQYVIQPTCLLGCPYGKYMIRIAGKLQCFSCHSTCYSCKGPSENDCTKCAWGKYLWQGTCIDDCPTGRHDSQGNCIKTTGNATSAIAINSIGDASGYITGERDIYLMLRVLDKRFSVLSTEWGKIPPDRYSSNTEPLFQNNTDVNTTVAIIRKEYISEMSVGSKLVIGVTANIFNMSNKDINGTASDIVILTRRAPMEAGNITIYPPVGLTQETEFTVYLYNWTFLNDTSVEVWVKYDREVLLLRQTVDPYDTIRLRYFKFPHWGLLDKSQERTFPVRIIAKKQNEKVMVSTVVTLTNNYTKGNVKEKLQEVSTQEIQSEDTAMLMSSMLSTLAPPGRESVLCRSNADCSYHGVCEQRRCKCYEGWYGNNCGYDRELLPQMTNMSTKLNNYLKQNFLRDYSNKHMTVESVGTFVSIVENMGKAPELIEKDMADKMGEYLKEAEKGLAWANVSEMGSAKVGSFVKASLCVLKMKNNDFSEQLHKNDHIDARSQIAQDFSGVKDAMYNILSKAAQGLSPKNTLNVSSDEFEAKVGVFYTKDLSFPNRTQLYSLSDSGAGFDVPPSIFTDGPPELQNGETANIRMMRWSGNPYKFAKSADQVQSDVVGFSFLNSTGGEVHVEGLADPITIKIPIPSHLRSRSDLQCVYFDENAEENVTVNEYVEINVNELNLTDAEKRAQFPEWKRELYQAKPLIVRKLVEKNVTQKVGDFSTKGCYLRGLEGDKMVCQCNHLSDFAVKIELPEGPIGTTIVPIPYNDYSVTREGWYKSIGFIVSIALAGTFVLASVLTMLSKTVFYKKKDAKYASHDDTVTAQNIGEGSCKIVPGDAGVSKTGKAQETVITFRRNGQQQNDNSGLSSFVKVNKPTDMQRLDDDSGSVKQFDEEGIEIRAPPRIGHTQSPQKMEQSISQDNSIQAFTSPLETIPTKPAIQSASPTTCSSKFTRYNLILNIILIPDDFYTRTQRLSVLFFAYTSYALASCLFLSFFYQPLDTSLDFDMKGIWIGLVSAVAGDIMAYCLACICRSQSSPEGQKPNLVRKIVGYSVFALYLTGVAGLCTIYSTDYGWKFSYKWLWTFLMAFGWDLIVLELLVWLLHVLAGRSSLGGLIEKIRSLKVA